eukprot:gnl/TRDRNA2_/TRDRNA2_82957_c0_seq1.p1 gnl/TRDRNA2_/TRDRNA2_82957_c0~~gnl/TRDRNA2_/TRDRNA2_82957_c0_seq1.p1  ORF type:complete len:526 (+),score=91.38 gnl/TRDRNA2_/TRDRNA2_82957_c0_seq1:55-1578(+)
MVRCGAPAAAFATTLCLVSGIAAVSAAELSPGIFNTAVLEKDFCTSPPDAGDDGMSARQIDTGSMDCAKLMEFVYISRQKLWEHMQGLHADAAAGGVTTWRAAFRTVSRASSLMSAQVHILAAVSSQRSECFSEHVRLLLIVNLRRIKGLISGQYHIIWDVTQDGDGALPATLPKVTSWLKEAVDVLDGDLRTMRTVLTAWRQPPVEEARFYSHESDGRYSTMESLRRDTFEEWQMDKGMLKGLTRFVLPVDAAVLDLGAGSGQYAKWLNDTGLFTAYAFDGSPDIELVTKGAVLGADLGRPLDLWRKFDWALCLEVAEHVPPELTQQLLQNIDKHVNEGVVLSWARPGPEGVSFINPRTEAEVASLVRASTGLFVNEELTNKLRGAASLQHLRDTVLVLTRSPGAGSSPVCAAGDATCAAGGGASMVLSGKCSSEEGWIYAGNDVQMFNNVPNAAACCDLCSSHEQCRYWTWSREDTHKDLCWIKSTREYRINHEGFVSGTRSGEA